jgi:hypothetical protein
MDELRFARKCKPPKLIIPVFVEANHSNWCDMDLSYLCQLKSEDVKKFDFSKYNYSTPLVDFVATVGDTAADTVTPTTTGQSFTDRDKSIDMNKIIHINDITYREEEKEMTTSNATTNPTNKTANIIKNSNANTTINTTSNSNTSHFLKMHSNNDINSDSVRSDASQPNPINLSVDDDYSAFTIAKHDVDNLYKYLVRTALPEQLVVENLDAIKKAFE